MFLSLKYASKRAPKPFFLKCSKKRISSSIWAAGIQITQFVTSQFTKHFFVCIRGRGSFLVNIYRRPIGHTKDFMVQFVVMLSGKRLSWFGILGTVLLFMRWMLTRRACAAAARRFPDTAAATPPCTVLYLKMSVLLESIPNSLNPKDPISEKTL